MSLAEALILLGTIAGISIVITIVAAILKRRLPEQLSELIGQLVPVIIFGLWAMAVLIIIDPDQADRLVDSTVSSVPKVIVAVILIIVARALGRIVGMIIETGLRRASPVLASRARMIVSSAILGVGVIIALQQIGISTDIILILVAAFAFGLAATVALALGLGSVPLMKRVAAGRHVQNRFEEGQLIRVGDVEGRLTSIGLASSRVEAMDGGFVEVPNDEFLEGPVSILP